MAAQHPTPAMQSTFRGAGFQPTIYQPVFNAYSFLPTPPPQKPRPKPQQLPEPSTSEPAEVAGPPPAEEPPAEEPPAEEDPGELLMQSPLEEEQIMFNVLDRDKNYRACISKDGEVTNNRGVVIGYVNIADDECGSADSMYMGRSHMHAFDNVVNVWDAQDEVIGTIDMGTRTIRNTLGATVADIDAIGVAKHPNGIYLGQFVSKEIRSNLMAHIHVIAMYLMLLDPGMLSDSVG